MPAAQPNASRSIPETPEALSKVLGLKPVLWVGAGLSFAAGYPSTWKLVQAMAEAAIDPIDTSLPFFSVADAFVESLGKAALGDLLQRHMGQPRQPTASHRALARLAGAGHFSKRQHAQNHESHTKQTINRTRQRTAQDIEGPF